MQHVAFAVKTVEAVVIALSGIDLLRTGDSVTMMTVSKLTYGTTSPSQYVLLYLPSQPKHNMIQCRLPLLFFLHGGFWKGQYGIDPPTACCENIPTFATSQGWACALVEYRRDHDQVWGWPATNDDVLTAYKAVTGHPSIDPHLIAVVGHSAGGTLALWLTSQLVTVSMRANEFPPNTSPLRDSSFKHECIPYMPCTTIALAPVSNLSLAATLRLSDNGDAVQKYMHLTRDEANASLYAAACPTSHAHELARARVLLILGDRDDEIPEKVVRSTNDALVNARSVLQRQVKEPLPPLQFELVPNANHYDVVDVYSSAWRYVLDELRKVFDDTATTCRSGSVTEKE